MFEYSSPATELPEIRSGGEYKKINSENYFDLINYMNNLVIMGYDGTREMESATEIQQIVLSSFCNCLYEYYYKAQAGEHRFKAGLINRLFEAVYAYHCELYRFINGDSPVGSAAPIAYLTQMRPDLINEAEIRLMKWPAIHFSELFVNRDRVDFNMSYIEKQYRDKLIKSIGRYDVGRNFGTVKTVAEFLKRNLDNPLAIYGLMFRLFHANCVIELPILKGTKNEK